MSLAAHILRFLPLNHRYKKNIKDFFVGRVEKDVASPCLSGEELHDVVSKYGDIVFGLQSSNLDVIHIKKNAFENIFNTVMDVKGKTKDNIKSRLDIALYCNQGQASC